MASLDKNGDKWVHKCPAAGCQATFFTRPNYQVHQKLFHSEGIEIKVKKCGFLKCNHIFISELDYADHMRRIHGVMERMEREMQAKS
jgi:uncharacterized C2H2 Zn-finger protein